MKDTIVPHHTGDSTPGKQYQKTFDYHNRGAPRANGKLKWPKGHGIQYAAFIEKDGEIIWGDMYALLWHAGTWNYRSIGVCCAGDLRFENLTEAQVNSLVEVFDILKEKNPIEHIQNHYEIRPTSCPIINLREVYLIETRKRSIPKVMTPTVRVRMLNRLIRDSVGDLKDSYKRQLSRLWHRIEARSSDDRDCCTE